MADELDFTPDARWLAVRDDQAHRERRKQHYGFAHRYLRSFVIADPARFVRAVLVGHSDLVERLWNRYSESFALDNRIHSDGIAITLQPWTKQTCVVVRLPPAERPAEAHLVGVVTNWDQNPAEVTACRYFTLELGMSPIDAQICTVLCEWTADGHRNMGEGPPADEMAFFTALRSASAVRR